MSLSRENAFRRNPIRWTSPSDLYRRMRYHKICAYERDFYPQFDTVHLMTDVDAQHLQELNPKTHTTVIPNGTHVDLMSDASLDPDNRDLLTVISSLNEETLPSLDQFIQKAWPGIHAAHPEIKFHIIGRKNAATEQYETVPGIVFEGFVEHLRDAYAMASITLSLTDKNCGLLNKVIEAMAARHCVVGFKRGFAGLPQAIHETNCLMVDTHEQFADQVLRVIEQPDFRNAIQHAARTTAADSFSWESRRSAYEQMYQLAIASARSKQ